MNVINATVFASDDLDQLKDAFGEETLALAMALHSLHSLAQPTVSQICQSIARTAGRQEADAFREQSATVFAHVADAASSTVAEPGKVHEAFQALRELGERIVDQQRLMKMSEKGGLPN
jgi:hypothetical protein